MASPAAPGPLNLRRRDTLLAAAAAASPWPLAAQAAAAFALDVTVRAQELLHPANPLLVGSNTPWVYGSEGLMDQNGQWRNGPANRARELAPTVLRYPGTPDNYPWTEGIGPLAQRKPVMVYPGQPEQKIVYGTLEYLEACEWLGAQPLIELNMHQGSDAEVAERAVAWLRFINQRQHVSRITGRPCPKALLWELGNEPYLMERDHPLFVRTDHYVRRVNAVMSAMKAADPQVKFCLPFALDTYSGRPWKPNGEQATVVGPHLGWADKMLAGLERPQDLTFLAAHYYMPLITGPVNAQGLPLAMGSDEELYWGAVSGSETIRRHLGLVLDFWKHHPKTARLPAPRIAVTEYNSYFTSARVKDKEIRQNAYVMSQAGALYVADLLRVMANEPAVGLGAHWSLNGNWVFGAIEVVSQADPAPVRPSFHVLQAYRQLLAGGHMVPADVRTERTNKAKGISFAAAWPDMPLGAAVAARDGKRVQVIVINKDPSRPAQVRLHLPGVKVAEASVRQVEAPGLFGRAGQPDASVVVQPAVQGDTQGLAQWTLGPASFAWATLMLS